MLTRSKSQENLSIMNLTEVSSDECVKGKTNREWGHQEFRQVCLKKIARRDLEPRQLAYRLEGMQRKHRQLSFQLADAIKHVSTAPTLLLDREIKKISDLQVTVAHLKEQITQVKADYRHSCWASEVSLVKLNRQLKRGPKEMLSVKLSHAHYRLGKGWIS